MRLNLPTMKFHRLRGDMIDVYKILSGKYDAQIVPNLAKSETGYSWQLFQTQDRAF